MTDDIQPHDHEHHPHRRSVSLYRCRNGCVHLVAGQTTLHFTPGEFRRLTAAAIAIAAEDPADLAARRN